ncbi:hypothetical protein ACFQY5_31420 [Paeniroseomonas aquatica]|uniref:hypothetical protein n=1 Tax=Paeniroseomonas aquatica TaxID=373043 RepID=UPI00361DE244
MRRVGIGLAEQRHARLAQAARLGEEMLAQQAEPVERVPAAGAGLPAIGPFVVAGGIDQGRREAAHPAGGAADDDRVRAGLGAALGVAEEDAEGGGGGVDGPDQRLDPGQLAGAGGLVPAVAIGHVAEGDEAEGLGVGRGRQGKEQQEEECAHGPSLGAVLRPGQ